MKENKPVMRMPDENFTPEQARKEGYTVLPFKEGMQIQIGDFMFVVNNFVPEYGFMNLKFLGIKPQEPTFQEPEEKRIIT